MATAKKPEPRDANRDPITGQPGAHPVGVGIGTALGGAAAGAAAGMAAGPIGAAVGTIAGGVAGGLVGKGAAEAIDPTAEDAYWRKESSKRPYFAKGASYEKYQPAYRYGTQAAMTRKGRSYDESEVELERIWSEVDGDLDWDEARPAVKDAYDRVCTLQAGKR